MNTQPYNKPASRQGSFVHEQVIAPVRGAACNDMDKERLESLLDKSAPNGCWEWTKGLMNGYGSIKIGGKKGKTWGAHRYAYVLANGPIPNGLFVCHSCDNRKCCNPSHLWLGTLQDNHADMMQKGRHVSVAGEHLKGERHPLSKMTDKQRDEMRLLQKKGTSYRALAKMFGVSQPTAYWTCNPRTHSA